MRILNNNLMLDSTLSAVHPNVNYSLNNLKHEFLSLIYKSTTDTDTITSVFPTASSVNCLYFGFTNATGITVRLYNASNTLLATKVIGSTLGSFFTAVPLVKKIEIDLITTEPLLYLGGFGVGYANELENMVNGVIKRKIDSSSKSRSSYGQTLTNKIPWLKGFDLSFVCKGIDRYNEIYALFADIDRPVWIDIYEQLPSAVNPFYADVSFQEESQSWLVYRYKVSITEAR